MTRILWVWWLLILVVQALAAEDTSNPSPVKGAVPYSSQSIFGGLFSHASMGPVPTAPDSGLRLSLSVDWTNVWTEFRDDYYRDYLIDYEATVTRLDAWLPLSPRFELGFWVDDRRRFGGDLDRFIEGFHRAFGLDDENRTRIARDQVIFEMTPEGEPAFLIENPRGRAQTKIGLSLGYHSKKPPTWLDDLSYEVEIVHRRFRPDATTGGDFDLGLGVAGLRDVGQWTLFASAQATVVSASRFGPYEVEPIVPSLGFGAEWRRSKRSYIAQFLLMDGSLKVKGYSTPSYEVLLSVRQPLRGQLVFEFGLVDTLLNYGSGPDFGIHFGLMRISR